MIIDLKDNHDRHGYIINQTLVDYFIEYPETIINIEIIKGVFSDIKEPVPIILSGNFKDIYVGEESDNFNNFCHLKINYDGLGNFGGPYLKSISIDIDEEMLMYLTMKGL